MAQSGLSSINPSDVTWDASPSINPSDVTWDAPTATPPDALNTAERYAGLTTRAAGPYALAMGAGAAAGAPFGGVGAIPGAALGATALGATDLASLGYNALISTPLGLRRLPSGSEAIQNLMAQGGIGVAPNTPNERIYAAGVEAATAGMSQANALRRLAAVTPNTTARNVLTAMGENIPAQTAAATGAAIVPPTIEKVTNEESWLRSPIPMVIGSLLGGLASAKGAAGVRNVFSRFTTPSTDAFSASARAAYERAENANVRFTPASYDNFLDNLQTTLRTEGFNPDAHSQVASWLNRFERARSAGYGFMDLDKMRSEVNKGLGGKTDDNTRRLAGVITDEIDDYINAATPADVTQGNVRAAANALDDARRYWTARSKSQRIERLIERARLTRGDPVDALRAEFESFAKNEKKMRGFSADERAAIEDMAKSKNAITSMAELGDAMKLSKTLPLAAGGGYAATYAGADPLITALSGLGYLGVGSVLRRGAAELTGLKARDVARFMRGYRPETQPSNALISPLGQNTSQSLYNALGP